jgi:hypothetical protein
VATIGTLANRPTGLEQRRAERTLRWTALAFAVAVLLHNGDHLRRGGTSVEADVFWVGSAAILVEVGVVVAVLLRHRLAPLAAAAVGFGLAAGYVLVHFTPERGWLSDSLADGTDISAVSWAAASLEVAAAIALGVAGIAVLRRRGGLASATVPTPLARWQVVVTHPVVVALVLGNVAVFALSLADR